MNDIPYSAACERNQPYILEQLTHLLTEPSEVLEIGSGTGQHAVYFGHALPHVQWQTSDLASMHAGIHQRLQKENVSNVMSPILFDADKDELPENNYDAVFTANTFHIMSMTSVAHCLRKIGYTLKAGGLLIVYGPFNFNGVFTSQSNAEFDAILKSRDPHQGIRDFEWIVKLAKENHLSHHKTISMPANNFILVFAKR